MQSVAHCSSQLHSTVLFSAFEIIGSVYGKGIITMQTVHFTAFESVGPECGKVCMTMQQCTICQCIASECIERSEYGSVGLTLQQCTISLHLRVSKQGSSKSSERSEYGNGGLPPAAALFCHHLVSINSNPPHPHLHAHHGGHVQCDDRDDHLNLSPKFCSELLSAGLGSVWSSCLRLNIFFLTLRTWARLD